MSPLKGISIFDSLAKAIIGFGSFGLCFLAVVIWDTWGIMTPAILLGIAGAGLCSVLVNDKSILLSIILLLIVCLIVPLGYGTIINTLFAGTWIGLVVFFSGRVRIFAVLGYAILLGGAVLLRLLEAQLFLAVGFQVIAASLFHVATGFVVLGGIVRWIGLEVKKFLTT